MGENKKTTHFIRAPRGIHAMQDTDGNWTWAMQDAQGSVRGEVDNALAVLGIQHPDAYGNLFGQQGSIGLPFVYIGEMRDPIGQTLVFGDLQGMSLVFLW